MTVYVSVEGVLTCNKDLRIVFGGSVRDVKVFAGDTDISHMLTRILIDLKAGGQPEITLYASVREVMGELLAKKNDIHS